MKRIATARTKKILIIQNRKTTTIVTSRELCEESLKLSFLQNTALSRTDIRHHRANLISRRSRLGAQESRETL